mgnify:CR=1 FL=1
MRGMSQDVTPKPIDWSVLKTLFPYLLEFRARIGLAVLCLVLAKLASVGLPFILKHIVDGLDAKDVSELITLPLGLLLAYGVVRFSNVLFGELRDTLFGRVTERAMRRIGLQVFRHLHTLDLDFHLNRRTGGLSRDIERGTNGISFLLRFMVFNILPTLLEIGMVIGLLLWNYDVWFALIVAVSVAAYVGFSVFATEWRLAFIREANQAESSSSTRAIDSLLNYETVKYFTNEDFEARHYDENLERWELARGKNRLSLFALNAGQSLIISVAVTAAMVLAAVQVTDKVMTLGDFVLINAFMMQVFMPLNFLGFVYREMKGAMTNIENMFAVLDVKPGVVDRDDATELTVADGEIRFHDVHFGYGDTRDIIRGVSFTVPSKQKVAIVGSSGAGKSTLFKLLFRFYDVSSGDITIDGQSVRQVSQRSLRRQIGVVPQETVLFNTSIFENVRYGRIDASDDEVREAIRLAYLSDFIASLPKGESTMVGERGLKLSGGEKQMLAMTRTLMGDPSLIMIDEPTEGLSPQMVQKVAEVLKEIANRGISTLLVEQKLSIAMDIADRVYVMGHGQVVYEGTPAELRQRDDVRKEWLEV